MNRRRLLKTLLSASIALFVSPLAFAQDAKPGFAFQDTAGDHLDILLDGKIVGRYMYSHDVSTKEKRSANYKPFLHVFDAEGKEPITKGAQGQPFPHHRGIYVGWNKISLDGKGGYDRWHMKTGKDEKGDIVHQKFVDQKASPDEATFTSITHWEGDSADKQLLEEARTITFRRGPAPARVTIDLKTKLKAVAGEITLDGDPEHAGVQYRPAADLTTKETVYTYPVESADAHKDKDYPWVGMSYTLRGKRYSILAENHPTNPTGTRWSAYRDYGRFGAFAKTSIKAGESTSMNYRFLIIDGEMPGVEFIQKDYDQFSGATTPSALPKVTVKKAEGVDKPPATKPATKPAPKSPAKPAAPAAPK